MRKYSQVSISFLTLVVLSGCSAMFVLNTNDPYKKLNQAKNLIDIDRPLPAERLILESLNEFKKRNDELGIGRACRSLGQFYSSSKFGHWEKFYRKEGFWDKTVKFDDRYLKAIEYFHAAVKSFQTVDAFDMLTNVHLQIGYINRSRGNVPVACQAFDESLHSYNENIKKNPDATVNLPEGLSSYPEYVDSLKKGVGCDKE